MITHDKAIQTKYSLTKSPCLLISSFILCVYCLIFFSFKKVAITLVYSKRHRKTVGGCQVNRLCSLSVFLFPLLLHLHLFIGRPLVTALFFKLAPMSQSKCDCFPIQPTFFFLDRLRSDTGPKKKRCVKFGNSAFNPAVHFHFNDVILTNISYKQTVSCSTEALKKLEHFTEPVFMKYNVILNYCHCFRGL